MDGDSAVEVELFKADLWMQKEVLKTLQRPEGETPDLYMIHLDIIDRHNHLYTPMDKRVGEGNKVADKIIHSIFENLPDNTTLIMYGDHGSDNEGHHGDDTDLNHFTAFMVYSKDHKFRIPIQDKQFSLKDIAATISGILSQKTPFSNTGLLRPEYMIYGEEVSDTDMYKDLFMKLYLNMLQISEYQTEAEKNKVYADDQKELVLEFQEIVKTMRLEMFESLGK